METFESNSSLSRKSSENLLSRRKSNFSVKNENNLVNSSSLLSICSTNDFDLFKEEIHKRIQKREVEREKNRKLLKEEIKREKDIIKRMHSIKKNDDGEEKKRIYFNDKEFYGVSFEKPEKDEIIDLKKRTKSDTKSKKLTKKLREHQGDIFIEALTKCINKDNNTTSTETEEEPSEDSQLNTLAISNSKTIRSINEQIKMTWDTTDIFPVGIGETEGIDIFRIEDLGLASIDSDDYGSFCTGDCYVILNTYREDKELKHKIFQWVGKQAENDKLFCSAIYSVMLKGLINETQNIIREVEGEESDDLKDIFNSEIKYLDYNECAESRLTSPDEIQYPLRMYKIFDKGKIHLVETSHLMFNTNNVFLIDNGLELYQWNGKKSSTINKVFGSILLKRINSNERNNKAVIKEYEEFEEEPSFWELFEEERTEENASDFEETLNEKYSNILEVAQQPNKLYKVPDIESLDDVDCESYLEAEGFFFNKNLLKSENCYVMDCGVEIFLWTGNKASENSRYLIQEFTVKLIPNKLRPNWVGLHRFNENSEKEMFTIRFFNWGIPEDADLSKLILPNNCFKGDLKIDASALFNTNPSSLNFESVQLTNIMNNANENLQGIYGFVFDPLSCNFLEITESEIGQFYSKNSYIFLCIYKVNNETEDDSDDSDDSENENDNENELDPKYNSTKSHTIIGKKKTLNHKMNCVVYFWQGTMANRFAWLSFLYSKKDQIEAGTLAAYNEPLHVIILNQGSESLSFLSHLNNYCVYYKNKRLTYYDEANIINPLSYSCSNENISFELDEDKSKIYKKQQLRMFHIQTNQKYKTTRAWEVDIKAESLVSRDCFLVIYNNIDFVCKDNECNSEINDNNSINDNINDVVNEDNSENVNDNEVETVKDNEIVIDNNEVNTNNDNEINAVNDNDVTINENEVNTVNDNEVNLTNDNEITLNDNEVNSVNNNEITMDDNEVNVVNDNEVNVVNDNEVNTVNDNEVNSINNNETTMDNNEINIVNDNEVIVNENEVNIDNDNEINDNEVTVNDNEVNDNEVNDNEVNDIEVTVNDNEVNDNEINDNEVNDNEVTVNDNEVNENEVNDNEVTVNDNEVKDNEVTVNDNEVNDNGVTVNDNEVNNNEVNDNEITVNDNEVNDNEINDNEITVNDNEVNDNEVNDNEITVNDNEVNIDNDNEVTVNDNEINDNEVTENDNESNTVNDNEVTVNDNEVNDNEVNDN